MEKIYADSDYMEGAHPEILRRLTETNLEKTPGYGSDAYTASAREKIRTACEAPRAEVYFLTGGTQTNATVIDGLLRPYQGVVAARTGHISCHEAGAVEFGGHKVLEIEGKDGKICADSLKSYTDTYWEDENHEHMVMPGMVYLSQPTEYGTLYSLAELEAIAAVCRERDMALYVDGARLAYALACPENDVRLPDLARFCDAFYIGGTKCGALFGEAVVFPAGERVPHFFTMIKQHGALLAKGRIAGIQFDTLFSGDLYGEVGRTAIEAANRIRKELKRKGYTLQPETPTNQIFLLLEKEQAKKLSESVSMSFWENTDGDHCVMRIATSWATTAEETERLLGVFPALKEE